VSILEPWVQEEYGGNAQLLSYGQSNLGHTYNALGRKKDALEMFKKSEAFYPGTPDEFSMDHAAAAIEIAILSSDDDEIERSLATINVTLSEQENIYAKMYLLSKLHNMEYHRGNWEGAYDSIRSSVDIIEENSDLLSQGTDTRRLQLAHLEMFHTRNLESAQEQIDIANRINQEIKGENLISARLHQFQGTMFWIQGDSQSAAREYELSLPLIEKYEGQTDSYKRALARLVIFNADAGEFEKAAKFLSEAKSLNLDQDTFWLPLAALMFPKIRA